MSEPLEAYLRKVREHLRGLPEGEIAEILQELRSHVLDFAAGDLGDATVARALAKLGDAREIARLNLSLRVAAQSLDRRSPWAVARTIVRLAGLSVRGLIDLLLSLVAYAFAAAWLLTALAKPFAPDRVGLWRLGDAGSDLSLSLGRHVAGTVGHDVLGWWIVPLGLAVGMAVAYLTYLYDVSAIRRMARRRLEMAP